MSARRRSEGTAEAPRRFSSGHWFGYWYVTGQGARYWMRLDLTFHNGVMTGSGSDQCGLFLIRGRYSTADGRCQWMKRYLGGGDACCVGYDEGRGIWGRWESDENVRGGYHIWPADMDLLDREALLQSAQQSLVISLCPRVEERLRPVWVTGDEQR